MNHLNPKKVALAFGKTVGLIHLVWAVFVGLGWAQGIIDFSMWAHMVSAPVTVQAFDISAALAVIIVASLIGAVVGYVFALLWNRLHRA
jgi:hypothetical protein